MIVKQDESGLIPEEVLEEFTEEFVRQRARLYSPRIARTLVDDLREELIEGIQNGERIRDMRDRLSEVLVDQAPFRLERIVRTEVNGALNAGSVESYKIAGARKEWLTSRDDAVRGTDPRDPCSHVDADGQIVDADQPFIVCGEELMFPGDPNASAQVIVNCRCTVVPVLEEE